MYDSHHEDRDDPDIKDPIPADPANARARRRDHRDRTGQTGDGVATVLCTVATAASHDRLLRAVAPPHAITAFPSRARGAGRGRSWRALIGPTSIQVRFAASTSTTIARRSSVHGASASAAHSLSLDSDGPRF